MGWLTRPRNDTFVSDDGSHACHRQKQTSPTDGQKRQKAAAAASRIAHSGVLTL